MRLKCYKIVKVLPDGRRVSSGVENEYTLTYAKGKVTKARVGGVLVFNFLTEARQFVREGEEIWRCFCEGEISPLPPQQYFDSLVVSWDEAAIRAYWDTWVREQSLVYGDERHPFPPGTRAFREVELEEQISLF